jgi:hypothetical protein
MFPAEREVWTIESSCRVEAEGPPDRAPDRAGRKDHIEDHLHEDE